MFPMMITITSFEQLDRVRAVLFNDTKEGKLAPSGSRQTAAGAGVGGLPGKGETKADPKADAGSITEQMCKDIAMQCVAKGKRPAAEKLLVEFDAKILEGKKIRTASGLKPEQYAKFHAACTALLEEAA